MDEGMVIAGEWTKEDEKRWRSCQRVMRGIVAVGMIIAIPMFIMAIVSGLYDFINWIIF